MLDELYGRINERHIMDSMTIGEAALGLASEAGEVAQLIRKDRYEGKSLNEGEMLMELSDVLHYLVLACSCYGITLDDLARVNTAKMAAKDDGQLDGFDAAMHHFSALDFDAEFALIAQALGLAL